LPALRTAVAALLVPPPTPSPTASVPSAPLNLAAVPHKARGITLTWSIAATNGGSAITGYRIYRSTTSGTELFYAAVGTSTTFRDTATSKGVRYWYRVAAVNAAGTGPLSNESSAIAK
jgi:fibronectin type 3 domain-containing protein